MDDKIKLISAQDAEEKVTERCTDCESNNCLNCCIADIQMKILALPTIEAEPVKQGRWIDRNGHSVSKILSCYSAKCSECGLYSGMQYVNKPYNYCPYCGSRRRMDGENE